MNLSLSVRIGEEFHSKEKASMTLPQLAGLAVESGYHALCMRASQAGVQSAPEQVTDAAAVLRARGLAVSMVTGNFDIVYNNDRGPACLRGIGPFLALAERLGSTMIRVAMQSEEDIAWAQRAADEARSRGIRLVHQCHTRSLFETVEGIERTLRRIAHPNFGLIFEPANLELCGQDYGPDTIRRLAPWIFNVYLQNQILHPAGTTTLQTWCRGPVPFDLVPVHAPGGIDFPRVFHGLAAIGYHGPVTVHQAGSKDGSTAGMARDTAQYLKTLASNVGLS